MRFLLIIIFLVSCSGIPPALAECDSEHTENCTYTCKYCNQQADTWTPKGYPCMPHVVDTCVMKDPVCPTYQPVYVEYKGPTATYQGVTVETGMHLCCHGGEQFSYVGWQFNCVRL